MVKEGSGNGVSLCMGDLGGNMEGGLVYWGLKDM
jgi:hypothetical protein